MQSMIRTLLRQHGVSMKLIHSADGTQTEVKGFFQAAQSKSWQNMTAEATPIGEVSQGQYIYIGPGDVAAAEGDVLQVGERYFVFRRAEPYEYAGSSVYCWGLCVEKGADDAWAARY